MSANQSNSERGCALAWKVLTFRDLRERGIVLRSLREGIDTSNAAGRMVAGVLGSLAELELGRERRAAAREARRARGQHIGRPKALDASKSALARRMYAQGEPASTIAAALELAGRPSTARWQRQRTSDGPSALNASVAVRGP